jgi:RNA polymerase sigma-70 factor (ECF subfamily)
MVSSSGRSHSVGGLIQWETTMGTTMTTTEDGPAAEAIRAKSVNDFESFVKEAEPRLRRALVALYGTERGRDATAEALAFAWEHWASVEEVDNPVGYLFRVAQSKSRVRRTPAIFLSRSPDATEHAFEPQLPAALQSLSDHQRLAVVLVHGFGWRITEAAELLGVKPTTVQNHVERGLRRLRKSLGVDSSED